MVDIEELFNGFQGNFEKEQELKDKIWHISKEIDAAGRKMFKLLQVIHQTSDRTTVDKTLSDCEVILTSDVRQGYKNLETLLLPVAVPPFYQYHDQWRNVTQRMVFLVTLMRFLQDGTLCLYEKTAENLNMPVGKNGLELDLEDYLTGLLSMASELSRYAVNSVTHGDYEKPLEISKFVGELSAGFRLLTFKNDFLRKKYDALKYDVKKIEEVVYDLSIRGMSGDR